MRHTQINRSQSHGKNRSRIRFSTLFFSVIAALFSVSGLQAEDFYAPQSWVDGSLIFQNVMHNHQSFHVGHNGNGTLYAEWGDDYSHRWDLEPAGGNYYYLNNELFTNQRLYVDPGDGRPKAGAGSDDAYKWKFEPVGDYFFLRNKLFSQKRMHVGHNGNGELYAGWWTDDAFKWQVHVLSWVGEDIELTYRPSSFYMANDIVFENMAQSDRRLRVSYNLSSQPSAGWGVEGDLAFHWRLEESGETGFYFLRNQLHPSQRLHVGHNGNGQLYVGCSNDDALKWKLEPANHQTFRLRNKLHSLQRLRVDPNGQLSAEWGDNDEYKWLMIVTPPVTENTCQ